MKKRKEDIIEPGYSPKPRKQRKKQIPQRPSLPQRQGDDPIPPPIPPPIDPPEPDPIPSPSPSPSP